MGSKTRLALALLFAPPLGALLGCAIGAAIGTISAMPQVLSLTQAFVNQFTHWFMWILSVTYLSLLSVGLGFHTLAQRLGATGFVTYIVGGAVLAAVIVIIGALVSMGRWDVLPDALSDSGQYLAVAIPTGGATSGIAWLIRRPDRDAPNPPTATP